MKQLKDLSLRERKYAQTKVNLLRTTVAKLNEKRLDEISVRELCDEVFISEATFFNYFPQKSDLLVYYIKLWSLEMQWHIEKDGLFGFDAIEKIFTDNFRCQSAYWQLWYDGRNQRLLCFE
jgi:AcrR family transcriptional regulator